MNMELKPEKRTACERCGKFVVTGELQLINASWGRIRQKPWCVACLLDHASICTGCDELWALQNLTTDSADVTLCSSCRSNQILCNNCGRWTNDWDENENCPDCFPRNVHQYEYKPTPQFHPPKTEGELYLGVELETDGYPLEGNDKAANSLHDRFSDNERLFYLKEDCTLHTGFEIVTHPCTLQFHQQTFPWKQILSTVIQWGACEDTQTCGLHIHFNKTYFGQPNTLKEELAILKLMFLFEKFWDELVVFSRRTSYQIATQARKYAHPNGKITHTTSVSEVKTMKRDAGHGTAINLRPNDTIEIRLWNGTLTLEILLATLELTRYLITLAKKRAPTTLYKLTWKGLIHKINPKLYPNLKVYLERRQTKSVS